VQVGKRGLAELKTVGAWLVVTGLRGFQGTQKMRSHRKLTSERNDAPTHPGKKKSGQDKEEGKNIRKRAMKRDVHREGAGLVGKCATSGGFHREKKKKKGKAEKTKTNVGEAEELLHRKRRRADRMTADGNKKKDRSRKGWQGKKHKRRSPGKKNGFPHKNGWAGTEEVKGHSGLSIGDLGGTPGKWRNH